MVISSGLDLILRTQNAKDPHVETKIYGKGTLYYKALKELRAGKQETFRMWYIFPSPPTALATNNLFKRYMPKNQKDANAYLHHRTLGPRLVECTQAALLHRNKSFEEIFSSKEDAEAFLDAMRFFGEVGGEKSVFLEALRIFEKGEG